MSSSSLKSKGWHSHQLRPIFPGTRFPDFVFVFRTDKHWQKTSTDRLEKWWPSHLSNFLSTLPWTNNFLMRNLECGFKSLTCIKAVLVLQVPLWTDYWNGNRSILHNWCSSTPQALAICFVLLVRQLTTACEASPQACDKQPKASVKRLWSIPSSVWQAAKASVMFQANTKHLTDKYKASDRHLSDVCFFEAKASVKHI